MTVSFPVPVWKPVEIERMVFDLVNKCAKTTGLVLRPPVNVDAIAEKFLKVDLQVTDLQRLFGMSDVLGAAWFEDNVIRIDGSIENQEGRFAFTLGHEIGHWWMHRPLYEMEKVTLPLHPFQEGQAARPAVVCRSSIRPPAEKQADRFSALLLMPEADVRAAARKVRGSLPVMIDGLPTLQGGAGYNPDLRDFADEVMAAGDFTNVSNQAMRIRLVDLKLVADANDPQARLF